MNDSSQYWLPSSKGALYATQSLKPNPARAFLMSLMLQKSAAQMVPIPTIQTPGITSPELAARLHQRLLQLDMLDVFPTPHALQFTLSDQILSGQLASICDSQQALLADQQGFSLGVAGLQIDEAERLAGLCAELAAIRLRQASPSETSMDSIGLWQCDRLGNMTDCHLYPLLIGPHRLTLLASGPVRTDRRALADLIWMLIQRHGTPH